MMSILRRIDGRVDDMVFSQQIPANFLPRCSTATSTCASCCLRKLCSGLFPGIIPLSLRAGAPSPHAWRLDPQLKIPIINLHHDKAPLALVFPSLSRLIPRKHTRTGCFNEDRADHRGPRATNPPLLSIPSSSKCPDEILHCFVLLPPPSRIPRKPPLCPFSLRLHCRWRSSLFRLYTTGSRMSNRQIADNPMPCISLFDVPSRVWDPPGVMWPCSLTCSSGKDMFWGTFQKDRMSNRSFSKLNGSVSLCVSSHVEVLSF